MILYSLAMHGFDLTAEQEKAVEEYFRREAVDAANLETIRLYDPAEDERSTNQEE